MLIGGKDIYINIFYWRLSLVE